LAKALALWAAVQDIFGQCSRASWVGKGEGRMSLLDANRKEKMMRQTLLAMVLGMLVGAMLCYWVHPKYELKSCADTVVRINTWTGRTCVLRGCWWEVGEAGD